MLKSNLTETKIKKIHRKATRVSKCDKAREILQPLVEVQAVNPVAADALIKVIRKKRLTIDESLKLLADIYEAHKNNDEIVIDIGIAMEAARNIDFLNDAPSDHPLFSRMIHHLSEILLATSDKEKQQHILDGLASTARLMGRQYDRIAEKACTRMVELLPNTCWTHYNQGLFYKTRGEFAKGVEANLKAIALSKNPDEPYLWNLGICATGAGQGEVALKIWKDMGAKIEIGRLSLPEGRYPSCKVRLAERPLAERDAENDAPGREETVWIERLSPCHGIIRSVLYQDLGVDFGDFVLFDGAPVTMHKYGNEDVPVFPHLATLKRSNYQFFDFAATQGEPHFFYDLSSKFENDAIIYSHTENFSFLCSCCWENKTVDHHHEKTERNHIITGRIAIPPEMSPSEFLAQIDKALEGSKVDRLFSPDLCLAAGLKDRARIEERRYKMLLENSEED